MTINNSTKLDRRHRTTAATLLAAAQAPSPSADSYQPPRPMPPTACVALSYSLGSKVSGIAVADTSDRLGSRLTAGLPGQRWRRLRDVRDRTKRLCGAGRRH